MPSRKAWITPETIPAETICRTLFIPDDDIFYANVVGALLPLTYAENWEQVGAITPDEAAERSRELFDAFVASECENPSVPMTCDVAYYALPQGTNGGSYTTPNLTKIPFNGFMSPISGNVSIPAADSVFLIEPGKYLIHIDFQLYPSSTYVLCWFQQESGYDDIVFGLATGTVMVGKILNASILVNNYEQSQWTFRVQAGTSVANTFFGSPANRSGVQELYGTVSFLRLSDSE